MCGDALNKSLSIPKERNGQTPVPFHASVGQSYCQSLTKCYGPLFNTCSQLLDPLCEERFPHSLARLMLSSFNALPCAREIRGRGCTFI